MAYYVYILTNRTNKVLYTGMTNNLERRIFEHKNKMVEGFTKKYNLNKLVYFEEFLNPKEAIGNEKRVKGWIRSKKIELIEIRNRNWEDLSSTFSNCPVILTKSLSSSLRRKESRSFVPQDDAE